MEPDKVHDLPIFDLEINFDPKTNTVMIIANDLALEHLIDSCQMILQGIPGSHQHFLQEVNGTTGNVNELIVMKR